MFTKHIEDKKNNEMPNKTYLKLAKNIEINDYMLDHIDKVIDNQHI